MYSEIFNRGFVEHKRARELEKLKQKEELAARKQQEANAAELRNDVVEPDLVSIHTEFQEGFFASSDSDLSSDELIQIENGGS